MRVLRVLLVLLDFERLPRSPLWALLRVCGGVSRETQGVLRVTFASSLLWALCVTIPFCELTAAVSLCHVVWPQCHPRAWAPGASQGVLCSSPECNALCAPPATAATSGTIKLAASCPQQVCRCRIVSAGSLVVDESGLSSSFTVLPLSDTPADSGPLVVTFASSSVHIVNTTVDLCASPPAASNLEVGSTHTAPVLTPTLPRTQHAIYRSFEMSPVVTWCGVWGAVLS